MPLYKIADLFQDLEEPQDYTPPEEQEESDLPAPLRLADAIGNITGRTISRTKQAALGLAASPVGQPARSIAAAVREPSAIFQPQRFAEITTNLSQLADQERVAEQQYAQKQYPYSKATQEYQRGERSLLATPTAWAEIGTETMADMAPLALATAAGHPEAGLMYMSAKVGADSRNSAIDRGATESQATMEGLTNAATTYFTSKYLTVPYLENTTAKQALAQLTQGQMRRVATGALKGASHEAIQESLEQIEQQFSQWVYENDPHAFDELQRNLIESAFFGALSGGGFGGITGGRRVNMESALHEIVDEGGIDALNKFMDSVKNKTKPTRADFEQAGLTQRYNAEERANIARAIQSSMVAARAEEARLGKVKESKSISPDVPADDAGFPLTQEGEVPRTDIQAELRPIIEQRQQKVTESREAKYAQIERDVTRLQGRKRHYAELADKARAQGDEVAGDAYQRFVDEAQKEITNKLTVLQKSETEQPAPPLPVSIPTKTGVTEWQMPPEQPPTPPAEKASPVTATERLSQQPSESTVLIRNESKNPANLQYQQQTTKRITEETQPGEVFKSAPPTEKPLIKPGEAGTFRPEAFIPTNVWARARAVNEQGQVGGIFDSRLGKKIKHAGKKVIHGFKSPLPTEAAKRAADLQKLYVQAEFFKAETNVGDLRKQIKAALKAGELQPSTEGEPRGVGIFNNISWQDRMRIQEALSDRSKIITLPERLQKPISDMRKHIDANMVQHLESGAIGGPVELTLPDADFDRIAFLDYIRGLMADADQKVSGNRTNRDVALTELRQAGWSEADAQRVLTYIANDGMYLNRAYKAYTDQEWIERVPDETKQGFMDFLRDGYEQQNMPVPSDVELENQAMSILWRASNSLNPTAVAARGNLTSRELSALKRRKVMPEVVKQFLGEFSSDAIGNYYRTIYHQAMIQSQFDMLQKIREDGLANGYLFTKEDAPSGNFAEITTAKMPGLFPLNGLWTDPETEAILTGTYRSITQDPRWWRWLMIGLERPVVAGKIMWSPMTVMRQLPSNLLTAVANGHSPHHTFMNIQAVWTELARGKNAHTDFVLNAIKKGVLGETVEIGKLKELAGQYGTLQEFVDNLNVGGFGKILTKLNTTAERLYVSLDALHKLGEWRAEMNDYRKAFPEWSQEQLEEHTANIVRRINPTYSEVFPVVRALAKTPLSKITSYKSEVFRNYYERAKLIKEELSNPATRLIGLKRTVGLTASTAASIGWRGAGLSLLGKTIAMAMLPGWTDQDDKDMRELVNIYEKWSDFGTIGRDKHGNVDYFNISFSHPLATIGDAVRGLIGGEDWNEKAMSFATEILDNYVSPKFTVEVIAQWIANADDFGNPIVLETDTAPERIDKWIAHAEKILGPTAIRQMGQLWDAAAPPKESDLPPEQYSSQALKELANDATARSIMVAMITGFKRQTLNPRLMYRYKTQDFSKSMQEITSEFSRRISKTTDPNLIRKELQLMQMKHKKTFDEQVRKTQATLRLLRNYKFDELDAQELMKATGIDEDMTKQVLSNEFVPWVPSDLETLNKVRAVTDPNDPYYTMVSTERDRLIGSKVNSATSTTASEEDSASKARAVLDRFKIPVDEQRRALQEYWRQTDIRAEIRDMLKDNANPISEENAKAVAERVYPPGSYNNTPSRRNRLDMLNYIHQNEMEGQ